MSSELELRDRAAAIIEDIIETYDLSDKKLAEIMKCGKNTISKYRNAITTPGTKFMTRLSRYFGICVEWFHTGAGLPYYGEGMGGVEPLDTKSGLAPYPLAGSEDGAARGAESVAAPKSAYSPGMDYRISSVQGKAMRLLNSKSPLGDLLLQNIDYLDQAITAEKETVEMRIELGQVNDEVKSLKKRLRNREKKRRNAETSEKKPGERKPRTGETAERSTLQKPGNSKSGKGEKPDEPRRRKSEKT
ncbi:MAG: hypothetical protein GY859_33135 [Desulfobacterales bacterium]|nr:hypothetical protein [Desulfobacterales bacterium]